MHTSEARYHQYVRNLLVQDERARAAYVMVECQRSPLGKGRGVNRRVVTPIPLYKRGQPTLILSLTTRIGGILQPCTLNSMV